MQAALILTIAALKIKRRAASGTHVRIAVIIALLVFTIVRFAVLLLALRAKLHKVGAQRGWRAQLTVNPREVHGRRLQAVESLRWRGSSTTVLMKPALCRSAATIFRTIRLVVFPSLDQKLLHLAQRIHIGQGRFV
jgi:hypothetical protein